MKREKRSTSSKFLVYLFRKSMFLYVPFNPLYTHSFLATLSSSLFLFILPAFPGLLKNFAPPQCDPSGGRLVGKSATPKPETRRSTRRLHPPSQAGAPRPSLPQCTPGHRARPPQLPPQHLYQTGGGTRERSNTQPWWRVRGGCVTKRQYGGLNRGRRRRAESTRRGRRWEKIFCRPPRGRGQEDGAYG